MLHECTAFHLSTKATAPTFLLLPLPLLPLLLLPLPPFSITPPDRTAVMDLQTATHRMLKGVNAIIKRPRWKTRRAKKTPGGGSRRAESPRQEA
jgi:hypothetical protein